MDNQVPFLSLSVSAIAVMCYALFRALSLRSKIPGGKVRSTWNFLSFLIVLFTIGYFSTMASPNISRNSASVFLRCVPSALEQSNVFAWHVREFLQHRAGAPPQMARQSAAMSAVVLPMVADFVGRNP